MKTALFLFVTIVFLGCHTENTDPKSRENQSFADFECLSLQVDKSLTISEVNSKIFGEWQLFGMHTMLPSKEIPNIKLIMNNISASPSEKNIAEIFENNISKGKVKFNLKETKSEGYTYVILESENETLPADYYNFIRGNIRICTGELMIDNGMAFDAPAYLFRKIK